MCVRQLLIADLKMVGRRVGSLFGGLAVAQSVVFMLRLSFRPFVSVLIPLNNASVAECMDCIVVARGRFYIARNRRRVKLRHCESARAVVDSFIAVRWKA